MGSLIVLVRSLFADLRFVSIYLWQNKRIGENDPSLMRHIYKIFFSKIEELRNYVEKKDRISEQCHEFVKNKNRPILRGKIVLINIETKRKYAKSDCVINSYILE
jgi:hypothetical protein